MPNAPVVTCPHCPHCRAMVAAHPTPVSEKARKPPKIGECSFCNVAATCSAWGVASYGPGGGLDAHWAIFPACDRCADSDWGARPAHTRPSTSATRRVVGAPALPELIECSFVMSWAGMCHVKHPKSEGKFCARHRGLKCRCGRAASTDCDSVIGPMVCGMPLCGRCRCH